MARSRASARCVSFLLAAAMLGCAGCEGCKAPGSRRGKDLREAYDTTALAWVDALGASAGDGTSLATLTDGTFFFRTVGEDHRCDGRVSGGDAAFAAWLRCVRATPELQAFSSALQLYRKIRREDPSKGSDIAQYLPRVVGGDDAWSRFVGSAERQRAQAAVCR